MIAVVVSTVNDCHYCQTSHGAALRLLTKDPALADQVAADYHSAPLEPRQRAMLDWAVKVTSASGSCTESDVESLREAGWSDEDIMDMTETAAMFNFTNRLANSLGWTPNPEYENLGR
jgi:uncharacterized peroxidase-related enzyme